MDSDTDTEDHKGLQVSVLASTTRPLEEESDGEDILEDYPMLQDD